jgi:Iap family predicted aminopeptidase
MSEEALEQIKGILTEISNSLRNIEIVFSNWHFRETQIDPDDLEELIFMRKFKNRLGIRK